MKERLHEFLKSENKSSAQLAEEIGVQPSGISHILSGRNNPSLDFVLKMLEKYQFLSTDWLLFGRGTMYKEMKMPSLFDEVNTEKVRIDSGQPIKEAESMHREESHIEKEHSSSSLTGGTVKQGSAISHIVMFYKDNSFEEYIPRE